MIAQKQYLNTDSASPESAPMEFEIFKKLICTALKSNELPAREYELIALEQLHGRILAIDIQAERDLPPTHQSAMDGFALQSRDLEEGLNHFLIVGESAAGHPFSGQITRGNAIRIMTGAQVPNSCQYVIMKEDVHIRSENNIQINPGFTHSHSKNNIRLQGEDVATGETLFNKGHIITSKDFCLIANLGFKELPVMPQLKIGIVSSGDELIEPGNPVLLSQIYDANRPILKRLIEDMHQISVDFGILPDDEQIIENTLRNMSHCDVIISSGGASVGEYDHLKSIVQKLGHVQHHKVAMKPGKPFIFGTLLDKPYFGLPGNPVSAYIGFLELIQPALLAKLGVSQDSQSKFQKKLFLPITRDVHKKGNRLEFLRAKLCAQGVTPMEHQDSHRIKDLSRADAIIKIPAQVVQITKGTLVEVHLIE
jgi:molybdopterin molybdotransferase